MWVQHQDEDMPSTFSNIDKGWLAFTPSYKAPRVRLLYCTMRHRRLYTGSGGTWENTLPPWLRKRLLRRAYEAICYTHLTQVSHQPAGGWPWSPAPRHPVLASGRICSSLCATVAGG